MYMHTVPIARPVPLYCEQHVHQDRSGQIDTIGTKGGRSEIVTAGKREQDMQEALVGRKGEHTVRAFRGCTARLVRGVSRPRRFAPVVWTAGPAVTWYCCTP